MQTIQALNNLNELSSHSHPSFDKRWPTKDSTHYELLHDYLQKVNYSIQDFNSTVAGGLTRVNRDVVFLIASVDWIKEAAGQIPTCLHNNLLKDFSFSRQNELQAHKEYFQALRSFVIAHPLKTDRHKKFGLDGNYICVDIGPKTNTATFCYKNLFRITVQGLTPVNEIPDTDIVLSVYSKRDKAAFFQHLGFDMMDVRNTAALYIEYLYELDRYISGLRRQDWEL